ncbi:MAG: putative bifunctional diguanylate cyclase/phosphodiesterase [Alphaproteobacteria bacterium]
MSEILPLIADDTPFPDLISVLVASGDLFYDWDLAKDEISWSGNTRAVLGLQDATGLRAGAAYLKRVHVEDLPHRMIAISRHVDHGSVIDCEYRILGNDDVYLWVQERAIARFGANGCAIHLTGVIRSINDRKESESRLAFLGSHDALTGQFNRMRLREALEQSIERNVRLGHQGGFLLVAIDKLALLGEVYGEDVVDTLLLSAAKRIEGCLRAGDVVGRVGFDRFAIVLQRCSDGQMYQVAGRMLAAVREAPVPTGVGPLHITASAGATSFPTSAGNAREVVSQADSALRNAYKLGCDCFSDFIDVPANSIMHRRDLDVAEQVQRALRDNRFVLAYQPVVEAETGEIAFYEGLARMVGDDGKLVAAGSFVPIVEEMGLMRLIDRRVLELGLNTLESQPQVRLSINVSGLTVIDPIWLRMLEERLRGRVDMARRLILEITETVALDDIGEASRFVSSLCELGCQVALDDFGAGFTSFRHLRALHVDMVKIDGSFVRDLTANPDNLIFVKTLLGLADGINLTTVAECVETQEQADLLRAEGVRYLQGYYFGRPTIEPSWTRASGS